MSGYVQVKFFSKQIKTIFKQLLSVEIPDVQFSLPESSTIDELNGLINKVLSENDEKWTEKYFDFLFDGSLLRGSVQELYAENNLSIEDVVTIECFIREEAPTPEYSLPHEDWIGAVRSSKECLISGCYDSTIHVWSNKEEHMLTIPGHTGPVKCLAWVPTSDINCKQFVSGSQDQTIILWKYDFNRNKINCLQVGRGHERSVECICSNVDGSRLASGSFDNYLKIWNTDIDHSAQTIDEQASKKFKTNTNKTIVKTPMVTLSGHREVVSGVCWSDPAEVITCSWDHTIVVWDLELAGQKHSLAGSKALTSIAYSPLNNSLITGSCDRHVRLWDPRSKSLSSAKLTFTSHNGWVVAVDWSKDNPNLFISASYDQLVKLWDIRSNKAPLYDLSGHEDRLLCCDWSWPSSVVSGGVDNCVKVFAASR